MLPHFLTQAPPPPPPHSHSNPSSPPTLSLTQTQTHPPSPTPTGAGDPSAPSEDDPSDTELDTILSLAFSRSRLGIAYFNRSIGEFGWGETSEDTGNWRSVDYVKMRVNPSLILVTSKCDDGFLESLRKRGPCTVNGIDSGSDDDDDDEEMDIDDDDDDGGDGQRRRRGRKRRKRKEIRLKFLRFRDFSYVEGLKKLRLLKEVLKGQETDRGGAGAGVVGGGLGGTGQLQIPLVSNRNRDPEDQQESESEPMDMDVDEGGPQQQQEEGIPDLALLEGLSNVSLSENKEMVRAACGILSFITNNKLLFGGVTDKDALRCITSVQCMAFEGFLIMDVATIKALKIMSVDGSEDDSAIMGYGKKSLEKKSGARVVTTVFGLLASYVSSGVGKGLLRRWFASPVLDLAVLRERLDAVQFFVERPGPLSELRDELKHIADMRRITRRFAIGNTSIGDWVALLSSLCSFKQLFSNLFRDEPAQIAANSIPCLRRVADAYSDNVSYVLELLSKVFDFPESQELKRMVVLGGVCTDLDEKKNIYAGLDSLLAMVAEQEIKALPADFPYSLRVAYFPQLGYLIALPKDPELGENPVLQISGYQFYFMSDECVYYKNRTMVEMDECLGDVHEQVIDLESEIENTIARKIVDHYSKDLAGVTAVCAELDCLVAFACCAKELNYVRPELTNEPGILRVSNGRNPLQEHFVAQFIPNDVSIPGGGAGLLNVVTGPNMSGKSVYLRQIGHIVFLAHIGSFVPASRALVSLTDRIMTRMRSEGSTAVKHSTFASDVLQMNAMLRNSTRSSLLLIDEFGSGTLALDGIALLASSLLSFLRRGIQMPRIFVSTHYTEIVEERLIDVSLPLVQFWTMSVDVQTNGEVEDDRIVRSDQVVFLYKAVPGRVIPSYGAVVASLANIPNCMLFRARQVADMFRVGLPVEPLETAVSASKKRLYVDLVKRLWKVDCNSESEVAALLEVLEEREEE